MAQQVDLEQQQQQQQQSRSVKQNVNVLSIYSMMNFYLLWRNRPMNVLMYVYMYLRIYVSMYFICIALLLTFTVQSFVLVLQT
jgi:hypothetical protein